jgi:hypothetical protein
MSSVQRRRVMVRATVAHAPVTVIAHPTPAQLHAWWDAMYADPADLETAFSDFSPTTLVEFLRQDLLLVLCQLETQIIAAGWLHDLTRTPHGAVVEGWIGGWVAKPYRRRLGCVSWHLALDYFHTCGVEHIHSAINVANRVSIMFTIRTMGFTVVGTVPRFSLFRGVRTDAMILTWQTADRARAWRAAEAIARRRWPGELNDLPAGADTCRVLRRAQGGGQEGIPCKVGV